MAGRKERRQQDRRACRYRQGHTKKTIDNELLGNEEINRIAKPCAQKKDKSYHKRKGEGVEAIQHW